MTGAHGTPIVSVLMPSHNHGKFIKKAIDSVLAQTLTEIELVIVDDGSRDASPRIIAETQDPRVRCRLFERNRGACDAMNAALQMSAARFIAVCNSDDEWHPEKLARQMALFDELPGVGAIFSDVEWIGEDGRKLKPSQLPPLATVFRQRNRSRWSWLRTLLETENCLCHPSILVRRDAYALAGPYDNRFRQLPDLDMWTRIVEHFDIFVMPEKLLSFRIHSQNTSGPTPEISRRDLNERRFILHKTMDRISKENFMKAFGFRSISIDDELDLRIEQALYLLSYMGRYVVMFRELGLQRLFAIMADANALDRLAEKFGLSMADFHREMAAYTPWLDMVGGADAITENAAVGIRSIDLVKLLARRLRARAARHADRILRRSGPRRRVIGNADAPD